jgi:protein Tex
MEDSFIIDKIAKQSTYKDWQINNVVQLHRQGATIPFMARYRKEASGSLDEVAIADVIKAYEDLQTLIKRKESILETIRAQGKLTAELESKIRNCFDANVLEDLYLPYKPKRKTKAEIARQRGLEPLAKLIMSQSNADLDQFSKKLISDEVPSIEDALQGARDIIAEWISETDFVRDRARSIYRNSAVIQCKVVKNKAEEASAQTYKVFFDHKESLKRCPSHRFLAMSRGEKEGFLRLKLEIDKESILDWVSRRFIKKSQITATEHILAAIQDGWTRLICPSIENQVMSEYKEVADKEAISVFSKNLVQLLMAAPLGESAVLAIDPGYRTGCKVVCLDANGDFLEDDVFYLFDTESKKNSAAQRLHDLLNRNKISHIAIGNGTASRETEAFIRQTCREDQYNIHIVNEAGASIYSASKIAREEFPKKDVTVRGAISIGRRLQDPLAELVKIDPKAIGVGQYQHDVNQRLLKESLDAVVISCVNKIGVNLNTASEYLLSYLSGIGPSLAKKIVEFRGEHGSFSSLQELKKVPGLGPKAFEQSAGFMRIHHGANSLDSTGIHPETYHIVEKMAFDLDIGIENLIGNKQIVSDISAENYTSKEYGTPTILDIIKELEKPGYDPRGEATVFSFNNNIKTINDLHQGMVLPAIVSNITNFGAFVNLGIKESGLIHISQISHNRISSPHEVLSLGQELVVKVIELDVERKRISVSLKDL